MSHTIFPTQMETFLIAALCLWRITHLFSAEKGPFDSIGRLRRHAGNGFFGQALDCFLCLSLWLAMPLAYFVGSSWAQRLLLWPALSGAACLFEQATRRPSISGMVFEESREEENVL